ncbi:hypothetical protein AB1283_00985 [Bacillus sp. S13(2024)]|uniref:hypothetical protein n=1 Tax=Bacillus sp. S13(2024) TaxID=3162885 RepID=UPI003D204324
MQLYGNPKQNLIATLERMNEGIEQITEGVNILNDYDLELAFEDTEEFTKEDIMNAIRLIKDGLSLINE